MVVKVNKVEKKIINTKRQKKQLENSCEGNQEKHRFQALNKK